MMLVRATTPRSNDAASKVAGLIPGVDRPGAVCLPYVSEGERVERRLVLGVSWIEARVHCWGQL
jgi:hypothetical protein